MAVFGEYTRDDLICLECLKEEASIDRSETCFAGVGTIGSKHLSPDPEGSERLRTQNYL